MADQYLSPTPYANPLTGYSNDLIQGLLGYMKDKQRTQQMQGLAGLLESTGIPQSVERAAYAQSPKALLDALTNVNRANVPLLKAETADALMTLAPVGGASARLAERGAMAAGRAGERLAERVVPQVMERGGMPAQLLQDLGQGSIRPMDVWHGSPYRFNKFDSSKIGTGEGAQAFGEGLYFGEARGTGEEYARILANRDLSNQGRLNAHANAQRMVNLAGDPSYAIDDVRFVLESQPDHPQKKLLTETLGFLESGAYKKPLENTGNLYKVDLPDEAIAKMLDLDKPVSKQPTVMNALRLEAEQRVRDRKLADIENDIRATLPKQDIGNDYMAMFSDANVAVNQDVQAKALSKLNKMDLKGLVDKELDSMKPADMNWSMTGKEFYELLSKREGSPAKASAMLKAQGVTGNRYLDQGSRVAGGSNSSNFVVFPGNEDLLTIKEINDKAVGGLLGQSKAASAFDVSRRDASDIFGAGAERVMYKDPKSGGTMEVLAKPDGTASVLSLEVPETSRGKGIGQSLQAQVMQDFPEMMGQVSSKAAAKTAYRLGRRPPYMPDATLDDVYKMLEEDSSVNLVSPQMQKRFMPETTQEFAYPQEEAMMLAQQRAALPVEQGGLGLPAGNTAEQRAAAMGFDYNTIRFHGSDQDIYAFDPAKFGKNDQGWYGRGVTTDTDPEIASGYANYNEADNGQTVYPLVSRGKYMEWPEGQQPFSTARDSIAGTKDIQNLGYQGTRLTNDRDLYGDMPQFGTEQVTFNPEDIRSRFAAFDPFRRTAAIAASMGVAAPNLLAEESEKPKKKKNLLD